MQLRDFDKITCMCLDKRQDEWAPLEQQFLVRGAKIERFVVGKGHVLAPNQYDQIDPVTPPAYLLQRWRPYGINAYCCYLAHQKMLERAQKEKIQTLLMLEDDCQLLDNFDDIFHSVNQQLREHDVHWDLLYFGSNHTWARTKEVSPNLLKLCGGTYCWHCLAINQKYHDMIQHLLNLPPDGPFDYLTSIYTQTNPEFNCYAIWPTIAIQKPGMSYVLGGMQNYIEMFKNKGKPI